MKTKAHQRYKNKAGAVIPGVSNIKGQLGWSQAAFIKWANNLGLKGIDSSKYRDDKADIGSLAHKMLLCYHKGTKCNTSDYSENQIKQAENCLLSYWEWEKGKKIEPILVEEELTSEVHQYGGTPDFYGKVNDIYTLVDYKTGSGIWLDAYVQVAGGYKQLLLENGYAVDQVILLNIPRTEDESFQCKYAGKTGISWEIFYHCLKIYKLHKELKKLAK